MATVTLSITLPDEMKDMVEEMAANGGYVNTSEFLCDLVRKHVKERRQRDLEEALLGGLASGESVEYSRESMEDLTKRAIERLIPNR